MDKKTRQQKLNFIENQLSTLFCFSAEENADYMHRLYDYPDKGLDTFLQFLVDAKKGQDEILVKTFKRDPKFLKSFSLFLNKMTLNIKKRFESKEQISAESILKDI